MVYSYSYGYSNHFIENIQYFTGYFEYRCQRELPGVPGRYNDEEMNCARTTFCVCTGACYGQNQQAAFKEKHLNKLNDGAACKDLDVLRNPAKGVGPMTETNCMKILKMCTSGNTWIPATKASCPM